MGWHGPRVGANDDVIISRFQGMSDATPSITLICHAAVAWDETSRPRSSKIVDVLLSGLKGGHDTRLEWNV
jgi:hypothetical protein